MSVFSNLDPTHRVAMLALIMQRGCPDELIETVWTDLRVNYPQTVIVNPFELKLTLRQLWTAVDNAISKAETEYEPPTEE